MKTSHVIFAALISAAAIGGNAFAASSTDAGAKATATSEKWLTIPAIYDKVTAAGYSDINEIERGRDGYQIKATGPEGERVKLFVDPLSGEVLDVKAKKHKSDKPRSERTDAKRDQGSDALPNDAK